MQLSPALRTSSLRGRLGAAACLLLAAGMPAMARAESGATTQFDATALLYGERNRANVAEPTARITRRFADGQSLSAQFGFDVITGSSPSGASPSGVSQTTTSASGTVSTIPAGQMPLNAFKDSRFATDLEWQKPFLRSFLSTLGGHVSREKDYQSLGANGKLSAEFLQRRTTLTLGGGVNRDRVFPVGGIPIGLSAGSTPAASSALSKDVSTVMLGVSQVVTRRWLVGLNATRTFERGYLSEPYKVLSVLDASTGLPSGQLMEKRPSARERSSVLASSVYHLTDDVLSLSYRYYRDDWRVRSHTFGARYRRELGSDRYLEPHLRYYSQSAASFFRSGLVDGAPLPEFATADYRLGGLRSVTVGATCGFRLPGRPGEWTVRAEYIGQFGNGHPGDAVGIQRQFDLFPTVGIGSLLVGYSIEF
jgi:hypothetical protein